MVQRGHHPYSVGIGPRLQEGDQAARDHDPCSGLRQGLVPCRWSDWSLVAVGVYILGRDSTVGVVPSMVGLVGVVTTMVVGAPSMVVVVPSKVVVVPSIVGVVPSMVTELL